MADRYGAVDSGDARDAGGPGVPIDGSYIPYRARPATRTQDVYLPTVPTRSCDAGAGGRPDGSRWLAPPEDVRSMQEGANPQVGCASLANVVAAASLAAASPHQGMHRRCSLRRRP